MGGILGSERRFGLITRRPTCKHGEMEQHTMSNRSAIGRVRDVASGDDRPVVMLNLNQYTEAAGFPNGEPYQEYMRCLHRAVEAGGGKVLWQSVSEGQVIDCEHDAYDEVLAVWYPSHAAFLALPKADGADAMFAGRTTCVANASIIALAAEGPGLVGPEG